MLPQHLFLILASVEIGVVLAGLKVVMEVVTDIPRNHVIGQLFTVADVCDVDVRN